MEKAYYLCIYAMIRFEKEVDFDSREEQENMEDDTNDEEMDDVSL